MEKTQEILIENEFQRLDSFLAEYFKDFSRSKMQKMIYKGNILLNSKPAKASSRLKTGDKLQISGWKDTTELKAQNIKLDIKYEDEDLIVLNKPKNMLCHPSAYDSRNTLVNALLYHCGENLSDIGGNLRRGIVHRLDKNTAGLMLVAKTNEAHNKLAKQIKEKTAIRKYLAVVYGVLKEDYGVINKSLSRTLKETVKIRVANSCDKNAKDAITNFKVLKRFSDTTYLELQLQTGRTHQIRVHLASLGHPLVGDTLYGAKGRVSKTLGKLKTNEQILQSYYIRFSHPTTGAIIEFKLNKCDWDKDLIKVLEKLEGEAK